MVTRSLLFRLGPPGSPRVDRAFVPPFVLALSARARSKSGHRLSLGVLALSWFSSGRVVVGLLSSGLVRGVVQSHRLRAVSSSSVPAFAEVKLSSTSSLLAGRLPFGGSGCRAEWRSETSVGCK